MAFSGRRESLSALGMCLPTNSGVFVTMYPERQVHDTSYSRLVGFVRPLSFVSAWCQRARFCRGPMGQRDISTTHHRGDATWVHAGKGNSRGLSVHLGGCNLLGTPNLTGT